MNGKRYCTVVYWVVEPIMRIRKPVGVLVQTGTVECSWHLGPMARRSVDEIGLAMMNARAESAARDHHYRGARRYIQNAGPCWELVEHEIPAGVDPVEWALQALQVPAQ